MAGVPQILEGGPPNLSRQLAVAVRGIQWSYAIFWSISVGQPGVLEWGDGFYNGDIRTRRTCQGVELDADQLGLQRSEQLRDLYKSLAASAAGETNLLDKRPSAALSPEDLTEMEWYYLVCMSFVFNVGEGLPGTALANGQPIWLCNAHIANSKVFSRSLLAKSASIQTVVCFPLENGVVELGVNALVSEDTNLILNIKTTFSKNPYPVAVKESNLVSDNLDTDDNLTCVKLDCEIFSSFLRPPGAEYEEVKTSSPDQNSNGIGLNQTNDAFLVKRINGGASSSVQSWHFVDEDFSRGNHNAMEFSDCTSHTFVNSEKIISFPSCERVRNYPSPPKSQDCNEVHYQRVLLTLLKGPHQLTLGPHFRNCNKASSFVSWKKEGLEDFQEPRRRSSQRLLKKVLFEIAYMHNGVLVQSYGDDDANQNDSWRLEGCEAGMDKILVERRWRENINEKFVILKSLVPSVEVDDVSILDDTIDYLKGLKRRISELEEREITGPNDTVERTSDPQFGSGKKPLMNKRKVCEPDELSEIDLILLKNGAIDDVTVSVIEKDVLIEIKCPWRECLLLDIMDSLSNLRLDTHSVHSSTVDGLLSLTFKSKFKGSDVLTAAKLKRALQSVVRQF